MAKPEWGTKRICQSCGAPFYDLKRDPIVCPKCDATFDPEAVLKSRRARGSDEEPVEKPKKKEADASKIELETDDGDEVADDEDDEVLEDASDLGDDDMSDVIDAAEDEEDT